MARTFAAGQPHGPQHGPAGDRQAAALRIIRNHWAAFNEAPTRAELGHVLGISRVSAHLLVRKLARDGLVACEPGCWRNLQLTPAGVKVAS